VYGKIFSSIYEGTLYGHWEAIVTMQQLIVLSTADGMVDMTPQAIAARTSIPLDIIHKGLKILSEPDPYSRTPGEDGRRLGLIDEHRPWGWYLVNHEKYKHLQDADTVRAQTRDRVRKHRELKRTVTDGNGEKRHTDTNTDTDSKREEQAGSSRKNGARNAHIEASPVVQTLPLIDGGEFAVRKNLLAELEPLYPSVDVTATVAEMKGWLIGNPHRRKTRRGIKSFIVSWLHREQEKANGV
jgi:hypothetical protein